MNMNINNIDNLIKFSIREALRYGHVIKHSLFYDCWQYKMKDRNFSTRVQLLFHLIIADVV